jgi:DNA-binding MarR family transcriptional regulator
MGPKKHTRVDAVRTLARLTRLIERACGDTGLTLPQYRLLLLASRAPHRAGELASRAAVTRPALTELVDGLERQGYLRRGSVEGDKRGVRLELTEAGATVLAETDRSLVDRLGGHLKAGGAELLEALHRVAQDMDDHWPERAKEPR